MARHSFGRAAPRHPVGLMYRYYRYILPEVRLRLAEWRSRACAIPDPELRKQALASIDTKQFHCEGGAVYAAADLEYRRVLIPLIVAFQTISDYLDNLCDRSTSLDGDNFRRMHRAMLDAIDPDAEPANYYEYNREREDGGYLASLVMECQNRVKQLPSYHLVQPYVGKLAGLYCDLQVYKHIRKDLREKALDDWWQLHRRDYPGIRWNEFAAATGSTLGVFMLFLTAAREDRLTLSDADTVRTAYFPYICGLHILLDYLIDQQEDKEGGDLNFCRYYDSPEQAAERIGFMADEARRVIRQLETPRFHAMIVEGLLALYLSDPKAGKQQGVRVTRAILMKKSPISRVFFWFNSVWVRRTQ